MQKLINSLPKQDLEKLQELKRFLLIKAKRRASNDIIYFINEFLYTFNPKVEPYHFPFHLFPFQKDLVYKLKKKIETGEDIFIEKCREMGATYTVLAVFFWFWRFVPGSNFLLGSRKEDYVDNRKVTGAGELSNKEESLFGKIEYFLSKLDPVMFPKGFNIDKHFSYMSLKNPENGNVISGESSNPNFSRGGRQKAVLLDEFAFWDNASQAWGSTADTTDCRICLTTPGMMQNKAKRLRFGQDGEKIEVISLHYNLDPRKTEEWLEKERERRSSEDFAREIMINWEGSIEGRVYPEIKQAEVGTFPYDPAWGLYVAWDFGLDGVAISWWQINKYNGKLRLIDSYENQNKPIQFYFPLFKEKIDSTFDYTQDDLDAINAVIPFKKGIHFGDPDVAKRSMAIPTMASNKRELSKIGIYVQTKPASNEFAVRREKTKVLLQRGIEVNKTVRNDQWLECIKNARYPQRLETSQATGEIVKPIHDWTSHHRTALEYLAVNIELPDSFIPREKTPQERIFDKLQGKDKDKEIDDDVLGDYY